MSLEWAVAGLLQGESFGTIAGWLGHQLDPLGRLLLAAGLGAILGAERELSQRAAGLRTNILIALGSSLFTLVSIHMANVDGGDPTRIPAQIVTGIGFLGGGAILRGRGDIRGLTTAATIWVNAAVGMAAGAGFYILAIVSTIVTLLVLTSFRRIEDYMATRAAATSDSPDPIVHVDKNGP
jgi:putative Mg2+ transporter-C (MgtC) family protein